MGHLLSTGEIDTKLRFTRPLFGNLVFAFQSQPYCLFDPRLQLAVLLQRSYRCEKPPELDGRQWCFCEKGDACVAGRQGTERPWM